MTMEAFIPSTICDNRERHKKARNCETGGSLPAACLFGGTICIVIRDQSQSSVWLRLIILVLVVPTYRCTLSGDCLLSACRSTRILDKVGLAHQSNASLVLPSSSSMTTTLVARSEAKLLAFSSSASAIDGILKASGGAVGWKFLPKCVSRSESDGSPSMSSTSFP